MSALGLGELTLDSYLNEPLKARVDLLNTGGLSGYQIKVRLATSDDFQRMGIDRVYFLTKIQFEVVIDENGRGKIILTSEESVLEPYLDFILEVRWPSGQLLREYTVLIDFPVHDQAAPIASAREKTRETEAAMSARDQTSDASAEVDSITPESKRREAPEHEYGADTEPDPVAGTRYMIRRDETLWKIARKSRVEGASIHQTMLDIQRLNPRAFYGNNINRMKAGYIIYLPGSADIGSDDTASVLAEVRQQNLAWQDYHSPGERSSTGSSLRISAEPNEDELAGESEDELDDGDTAPNSAAGGSLESIERELSEVEQSLAAMAERVDTLERIVSLKDDQIAALQNALAQAAANSEGESDVSDEVFEAVEAVEVDSGVALLDDSLEVVEEPEEETGEETGESGGPVEQATEEADDQAGQPVVETEEPHSKEAVAAAESPALSESDDGLMGGLMYLLGLVLAVSLAVVYFLIRRRNKDQASSGAGDSEDIFAGVQLADSNFEIDDFGGTEPEAEPELEMWEPADEPEEPEEEKDNRGYGEHKNDEYAADMDVVDALAEADIYIAYGRYPQAVDLLKTAIAGEPNNPDYREKLIELSVEMGDQEEAQQQYADLQIIDDANSLARAQEAMAGTDWLEDLPASSVAAVDAGNEKEQAGVEGGDELDVGHLLDDNESTVSESELPELEDILESELAEIEDISESELPELEDILESELTEIEDVADSGLPELEDILESEVPQLDDVSEPGLEDILESELSGLEDVPESELAELENMLESELPELESVSEPDLQDLEEITAQDQVAGSAASDLTESGDLEPPDLTDNGEFETDFEGLEIEPAVDAASLDDLDLTAGIGNAELKEGLVFSDEGDELSTKLDLARAYIDMDDDKGAKQLLDEVLANGSDMQKEEAQALREKID
ncbi:MAG: hypothetical protein HOC23_23285 [Halieaceae bacterium]|nr:hypothetical protein [Halieaceae bacterium]